MAPPRQQRPEQPTTVFPRPRSSTGVEQTLYTTAEHPVYALGKGWVEAGDIQPGDLLQEPDGGISTLLSCRKEAHPDGITVYNFRVHEAHTYFVREQGSTAEPVWVHNAGAVYDGRLFAEEEAVNNASWNSRVEYGGRRVYQRADLFDPYAQFDGASNLERMAGGRAPIGFDGEPVELHHLIQSEPGPMAEISYTLHDQVPHGLAEAGESFRYSANGMKTEAQLAFDRWKYSYWQWRAKGF